MKDIQIGIIAEGVSDIAVISNILMSLGVENHQIKALRPQTRTDATDTHTQPEKQHGGWRKVKEDCESGEPFHDFLNHIPDSCIVVHLDASESYDYQVQRPTDSHQNDSDYYSKLRTVLIEKINSWLQQPFTDKLLYAIAIEETDAWVWTIYEDVNTIHHPKPKEELNDLFFGSKRNIQKNGKTIVNKYQIRGGKNKFEFYDKISKPFFIKTDHLNSLYECLQYNTSLKEFVEEVKSKLEIKK